MGVFPQIMSAISEFLGFKSTVNMVYLIVIFVLIVKLFYNTIQISALENKVDSLAQQIAIDRKIDAEEKKGNSGERLSAMYVILLRFHFAVNCIWKCNK